MSLSSSFPAVLLVDDDPAVLSALSAGLSGVATLHTATSGEDALRWLLAGGRADAIVTDHRMAEMTGLELLAQAHVLAPSARLALHTGDPAVTVLLQPGGCLTLFGKPARLDALRGFVLGGAQACAAARVPPR